MPKNREILSSYVRTYYTTPGKHSCTDCVHCQEELGYFGYVFKCKVSKKDSVLHKYFPYDNTSCKEFKSKHE